MVQQLYQPRMPHLINPVLCRVQAAQAGGLAGILEQQQAEKEAQAQQEIEQGDTIDLGWDHQISGKGAGIE